MRNEECKMKNEEVGAGNSKLEIINSKGEEKAEDRQPRRVAQSLGRGLANVNWQFLSYLHESFVLFETRTGLVTLNWRAAQERVLFEEVMESLGAGTPPRQALLFPIAMEFDPLTDAAISEHARFIRESGFELNPFGRLFYRLEAVPEWFEPAEAEQFMRDIAAQLRERGLRPEKQESAREQLARMAAAASTRNTPRPKEPELRALLNRLFRCKQPLSDPKGRPTLIETPKTELARKFGLGL